MDIPDSRSMVSTDKGATTATATPLIDILGDRVPLDLTTMGVVLPDRRVLTCVPIWNAHARRRPAGPPTGMDILAVPIDTVDIANHARVKPPLSAPTLGCIVSAIWELQKGQRNLTPPYGSPYIDKPIKTFLAMPNGVIQPVAGFARETLMNDAALMNYVLGKSRGEQMGLVDRTWREARRLVADFSALAWVEVASLRGDRRKGIHLAMEVSQGELSSLRRAIRRPGDVATWMVGACWLGCWHDHMHTKKDMASSSMRSWFGRIESPLVRFKPLSRDEFMSYDAIREVMRIGLECVSPCWVLPDESEDDDPPVDVMSSWRVWDGWFEQELRIVRAEGTDDDLNRIRQETKLAETREAEAEDAPDDILPEHLAERNRMFLESLDEEQEEDMWPVDEQADS